MNEIIPVHAEKTVNFAKNSQRTSFTINPVDTIKPGICRASVHTEGAYLSPVEFRFRVLYPKIFELKSKKAEL